MNQSGAPLVVGGFLPAGADVLGCAPGKPNFKIKIHTRQHPTPEPSPGKALIYILGQKMKIASGPLDPTALPAYLVKWFSLPLAVNGHWIGAILGNAYFYFEAEPGLLSFCQYILYLTVEPGKTYYLGGHDFPDLVELTEHQGKERIAKCRFVTFKPKR